MCIVLHDLAGLRNVLSRVCINVCLSCFSGLGSRIGKNIKQHVEVYWVYTRNLPPDQPIQKMGGSVAGSSQSRTG